MPLTLKQARQSDFYKNVDDADEAKQLKAIQEALSRMQISGSSADSTNPLRDENDTLLSFEDPDEPGESIEQPYQYVRLNIRQKSTQVSDYVKYLGEDIIFKEIFPEPLKQEDSADEIELITLKEELASQIENSEELNNSLVDSINELSLAIATTNETDPPTPLEKTFTSDNIKAILEKVENSKAFKNAQKVKEKLNEIK